MEIDKNLHNDVFDWLMKWSNEAQIKEELNPYFATRFRRDQKFQSGLFFQGNHEYLGITFWTGSDYINKTPNIYFEIHVKHGIKGLMIGMDSENKAKYFEKLSRSMPQWKPARRKGTFMRIFSRNIESWPAALEMFIKEDKAFIDQYLKNTLAKTDEEDYQLLDDEYSSKFGFISPDQFDQMISRVHEEKHKLAREANLKLIEEKSKNLGPRAKREMKLAIQSITVSKYHDIKDTSIDHLPSSANWIFLTGENGFGKTSVLQAIALGLTNFKANYDYLSEKTSIQIGFLDDGRTHVNTNRIYEKKDDFTPLNRRLIAYGPARLNTMVNENRNLGSTEMENIYNLFNTDGRLKNMDYELSRTFFDNKKDFKLLVSAINKSTGGYISRVNVQRNLEVTYQEKLGENEYSSPLPIEKISAGYRSIINIIGDIVVRLYDRKRHTKLEDIVGIVLIDEIENHLHPILQKKIPGLLSEVFPNIQFIASTHSPIPILGAPENAVILKVKRSGEGTEIQRMDDKIYVQDLMPNTILSSPIFDLEDITHNDSNLDKPPRTESTFEEKQFNDQLKKNINRFLTNEKEEELIRLFNERRKKE